MKKILIIAFTLVLAISSGAKTIHWLTFVDTSDKRVGTLDINGHKVLYDNFVNEINAALADNGYESDVQDFTGSNVSPENCKSAVQLLRVGKDDIIVFYYIGHGGRPNTLSGEIEQHPFPQLYLAQSNPERCIPLEWIHNTLKAKGARLSVTIGMACNSLDNGMSVKRGPTFSVNYGESKMDARKLKHIQELFLSVKGNIIATSALPTQSSIGAETIFGPMDFYSASICEVFKNELSNWTGKFSWENFLDRVEDIVKTSSGGEQTPFYIANLTPVSAPVPPGGGSKTTATPIPTPTQVKTDLNILTNKLTQLASTSFSDDARISMEQSLNNLFANGAVVKFLPQDGETVIDKETADVFLGRLSTANLILKVTVVDAKFNSSDKITELKVKETYRKHITD